MIFEFIGTKYIRTNFVKLFDFDGRTTCINDDGDDKILPIIVGKTI